MAKAAARHKANAMNEELLDPLLQTAVDTDDNPEDEGSVGNDNNPNEDIEKQSPLQKLKTTVVYGILVGGIATFALAFVFAPQSLVYVAGAICMANIPYSAYKEDCLSKIPTLRSLNNALRADTNRLGEEISTLSTEIDLLEPEADRASVAQEQLQEIADAQQCNVDKLLGLVKENQDIFDAMKVNVRQMVVQDIIKIVVESDEDNDMKISKLESQILALKIRIQLQEHGVDFNEKKFLKLMGEDPHVTQVISIVQKLFPQDGTDEEEGREEDDDAEAMQDIYEMFTWQHGEDPENRESLMAPTHRETRALRRKTRLSGRKTRLSEREFVVSTGEAVVSTGRHRRRSRLKNKLLGKLKSTK